MYEWRYGMSKLVRIAVVVATFASVHTAYAASSYRWSGYSAIYGEPGNGSPNWHDGGR
jgi:hypothetical protein